MKTKLKSENDHRRSTCHVLKPDGHLPLPSRCALPLHSGQQLEVDDQVLNVMKGVSLCVCVCVCVCEF